MTAVACEQGMRTLHCWSRGEQHCRSWSANTLPRVAVLPWTGSPMRKFMQSGESVTCAGVCGVRRAICNTLVIYHRMWSSERTTIIFDASRQARIDPYSKTRCERRRCRFSSWRATALRQRCSLLFWLHTSVRCHIATPNVCSRADSSPRRESCQSHRPSALVDLRFCSLAVGSYQRSPEITRSRFKLTPPTLASLRSSTTSDTLCHSLDHPSCRPASSP